MAKDIIPFSKELAQSFYTATEQFPVDFDIAWQWMGYTRRDNAKRLLKQFKEGRDFLKTEEKTTGRAFQRFFLSVDCFKSLSMMAQTAQGDLIREYFLECERRAIAATNLSPAEFLLHAAQQLVELERRQKELELENQRLRLDQEQIRAEQALIEETVQQHDAEIGRIFEPDGMMVSLTGCLNLHGKSASAARLAPVGKKATKLYREKYGKEPEAIGDARYGSVRVYPQAIAEQALSEFGYLD